MTTDYQAYLYVVDVTKAFEDYGFEQRPEMFQDRFRLRNDLLPEKAGNRRPENSLANLEEVIPF